MTQEIITVEDVKVWPDGGVSIKDHIGRYLKPGKNLTGVDWVSFKGSTLTCNVNSWTNPNSGKVTLFINDYDMAPGNGQFTAVPPVTAPVAPPAAQSAPSTTAHAPLEKDASIAALALVKAWTGCPREVSLADVWQAYSWFRGRVLGGDYNDPAQVAEPPAPAPAGPSIDPNDEIPF